MNNHDGERSKEGAQPHHGRTYGLVFFVGGVLSALLFCAIVLICLCFVCRHPISIGMTVIVCATALLVTYAVSLLILAIRWIGYLQNSEEKKAECCRYQNLMQRISDVYVEHKSVQCADCRCSCIKCERFRKKE